jgi:hypothetical protein
VSEAPWQWIIGQSGGPPDAFATSYARRTPAVTP